MPKARSAIPIATREKPAIYLNDIFTLLLSRYSYLRDYRS